MRENIRYRTVSWTVIRVIMMFWAVIWFGSPAMAVDYYVDVTNGDNGYLGTSSDQAFQTLAHALDTLNSLNLAADTAVLYVAAGTYSVALEGDASHLIANANITIKGDGNTTTIVDGSGSADWTNGFDISDSSANITITGLQFTGFSNSGVNIAPSENVKIIDCAFSANGYGVAIDGAMATGSAPVILGNTITGSTMNGINVNNGTGNLLAPVIKGNAISNSTYNAIYLNSSVGIISGEISMNELASAGDYGINMYSMGGLSTVIASNVIENCTTGIYVPNDYGTCAPVIRNNLITNANSGGYGIYIMEGTGGASPEVYFNTIDGGTVSEKGIYIYGFATSSNMVVRYNCVTNFATSGIEQDASFSATLDVDYNNAYNNGANYSVNLTVGNNIQADPDYAVSGDFSIPDTSPCVDAVPAAVVVAGTVDDDIIGTSRPRASSSTASADYDIGCYEYPYQEYTFTMPAGTGLATDYRLMTFPLTQDGEFSTVFQNAFGTYDNTVYRAFMYDTSLQSPDYVEMNNQNFDRAFANWQGKGFWVISKSDALASQTYTFEGNLTGNRQPFKVMLAQGWNLIGLPWPSSTANPDSIELGNIVVDDDTGTYRLTDVENGVTQAGVWDYTDTGYALLSLDTDGMVPGKGYWIYAYSTTATVLIPPDNVSADYSLKKTATAGARMATKANTGLTPPPPPGQNLQAEGEKGCFIQALFSEM